MHRSKLTAKHYTRLLHAQMHWQKPGHGALAVDMRARRLGAIRIAPSFMGANSDCSVTKFHVLDPATWFQKEKLASRFFLNKLILEYGVRTLTSSTRRQQVLGRLMSAWSA